MRVTLAGLLSAVCVLSAHVAWSQAPPAQSQRQFGGTYDLLEPAQRRLIDDWVRRLSGVTGTTVPPDVVYNLIRLSSRTTFDAVTHALMTTALTDESGQSLGTALDLVDYVETVKGKVKGASGDQQFRMYVALKADAREILDRSQEFQRKGDNTVYHKGYPINYRGGGVPSIQFSLARESNRSDIDVDYRSSSFPVSLFNGHLSSSNSDVRAGNNHDRHVNRWSGLQDWWLGMFGLPLGRSDDDEATASEGGVIPQEPPAGRGDFHDAVHDFLSSWLVEGRPNVSMSYLSDRAYECLQLETEETIDRGMAPFILLKRMADANRALGPKSSLEGTTVGVRLVGPSLRVIENPHHAQFVLYEVAEDLASSFECVNRTQAVSRASTTRPRTFGKYYGSIFYIEGPTRASTMALLWEKVDGVWKIVSYEVEPEGEDTETPDLRPTEVVEEVEIQRTDGDPRFISVTEDFMRSWLIEKDVERAFGYLSPRAYSCYNVLRSEDQPEAVSPEEAARHIRTGMERALELPDVSGLDEIVHGVEVTNPRLVVVTHPNESAYTLIAAPGEIGESFDCAARSRGEEPPSESRLAYGDYFGIAFQFHLEQGSGATLIVGWAQEEGQWKVFSYDVEVP